jgi:integration host factor subunit alpha
MEKKEHQQTLTRACLRDALQNQLSMPLDTASVVLESILKESSNLIVKGDCLKIVGFGTFLIHEKKARIGRNPKTKEEKIISPRKSVSFRPSVNLRQMVDKKAEHTPTNAQ